MDAKMLDLPDGRRMCWAEYGDPDGAPLLLFHGNPGSRLCWGEWPGLESLADARLIAPDRPGYGRTDFHPTTSVRSRTISASIGSRSSGHLAAHPTPSPARGSSPTV
jgi:pimeloyl-ACP methyl ester carboxylesterase